MLHEAREMLIEAVMARFDAIPEDISAAIREIGDRDRLKLLLRQAITCETIGALRKKIFASEP